MERENTDRDVATKWITAVTAYDAEAAIALSSPSIVFTTGQVRRYEGHEGVRDIVSDLRRLDGFLTVTILDLIEERGIVALRRLEQYVLPSGTIHTAGCSFVEVQDGLVTRWMDYKSMQLIDDVAN